MNKQIQEIWERINAERYDISRLLSQIEKFEQTFAETDLTADDRAMISFFRTIADQLEDTIAEIDFYNQPVTHQGQLQKNQNNRYKVEGHELHCGRRLEFLETTEDEWVKSRIEHSDKDYYIPRHSGSLEGLEVRIR